MRVFCCLLISTNYTNVIDVISELTEFCDILLDLLQWSAKIKIHPNQPFYGGYCKWWHPESLIVTANFVIVQYNFQIPPYFSAQFISQKLQKKTTGHLKINILFPYDWHIWTIFHSFKFSLVILFTPNIKYPSRCSSLNQSLWVLLVQRVWTFVCIFVNSQYHFPIIFRKFTTLYSYAIWALLTAKC